MRTLRRASIGVLSVVAVVAVALTAQSALSITAPTYVAAPKAAEYTADFRLELIGRRSAEERQAWETGVGPVLDDLWYKELARQEAVKREAARKAAAEKAAKEAASTRRLSCRTSPVPALESTGTPLLTVSPPTTGRRTPEMATTGVCNSASLHGEMLEEPATLIRRRLLNRSSVPRSCPMVVE